MTYFYICYNKSCSRSLSRNTWRSFKSAFPAKDQQLNSCSPAGTSFPSSWPLYFLDVGWVLSWRRLMSLSSLSSPRSGNNSVCWAVTLWRGGQAYDVGAEPSEPVSACTKSTFTKMFNPSPGRAPAHVFSSVIATVGAKPVRKRWGFVLPLPCLPSLVGPCFINVQHQTGAQLLPLKTRRSPKIVFL